MIVNTKCSRASIFANNLQSRFKKKCGLPQLNLTCSSQERKQNLQTWFATSSLAITSIENDDHGLLGGCRFEHCQEETNKTKHTPPFLSGELHASPKAVRLRSGTRRNAGALPARRAL